MGDCAQFLVESFLASYFTSITKDLFFLKTSGEKMKLAHLQKALDRELKELNEKLEFVNRLMTKMQEQTREPSDRLDDTKKLNKELPLKNVLH